MKVRAIKYFAVAVGKVCGSMWWMKQSQGANGFFLLWLKFTQVVWIDALLEKKKILVQERKVSRKKRADFFAISYYYWFDMHVDRGKKNGLSCTFYSFRYFLYFLGRYLHILMTTHACKHTHWIDFCPPFFLCSPPWQTKRNRERKIQCAGMFPFALMHVSLMLKPLKSRECYLPVLLFYWLSLCCDIRGSIHRAHSTLLQCLDWPDSCVCTTTTRTVSEPWLAVDVDMGRIISYYRVICVYLHVMTV